MLTQEYREDDESCEKLYSDPDMFFEIWKKDFVRKMDTEIIKRQERKKSRKSQSRRNIASAPKIITRVVRNRYGIEYSYRKYIIANHIL